MEKENKNTEFWYVCNNCGYIVEPEVYLTVMYNYVCPKCYKTKLSEFGIIVDIE